ncbi:MliC family protein [Pasteurella sp. P03HT]
MRTFKKLIPVAVACCTTACVQLGDIEMGGFNNQTTDSSLIQFRCENGYKGSIKHQAKGAISLVFRDNNKNRYANYLTTVPGTKATYVNNQNTLKWEDHHASGTFTFPAPDYRTSRQLLTTVCQKY